MTHIPTFSIKTVIPFFLIIALMMGCGEDEEDAEAPVEEQREDFIAAIGATTWQNSCAPIGDDGAGNTVYGVFEIGTPASEEPYFKAYAFGDEDCTFALFEMRILSTRGYGELLPGDIWELTVHFEEIYAVPLFDDLVDAFEMQSCGDGSWTLGEEQNVSDTGCMIWHAIDDCPADYDILHLDGDRLYNGVRTDNMCDPSGRPTELNDWYFEPIE